MFEGFKVQGNARQVFSRGELIVEYGRYVGRVGRGQYLRRAARGGAWTLAAQDSKLHQRESSLYNKDLAPVPAEKRTWGIYNYASLWVAMSVCIPTYMLASGLIAGGMSWKQAIGTILLGNVIVLIPMILNAHAGAKYGIPFPVLVRASFGVRGANVPAVLRALVACGWFGIQSWIGGQAIYTMLQVLWPGRGFERMDPLDLFLFVLAAHYGGDLARHRHHQVSWKASARRSCWQWACFCCGGSRARPADSVRCCTRRVSSKLPASSCASSFHH